MNVRQSKGQSLVEFALVLPLLLILIFGVIEFSILMYDKAVLTNASREGARAGIVATSPRPTDAAIKKVVDDYCLTYLITFGTASLTKTVTPPPYVSGQPLSVQVDYPYQFLVVPNFITTMAGGVTLTATTVMRIE